MVTELFLSLSLFFFLFLFPLIVSSLILYTFFAFHCRRNRSMYTLVSFNFIPTILCMFVYVQRFRASRTRQKRRSRCSARVPPFPKVFSKKRKNSFLLPKQTLYTRTHKRICIHGKLDFRDAEI